MGIYVFEENKPTELQFIPIMKAIVDAVENRRYGEEKKKRSTVDDGREEFWFGGGALDELEGAQ